MIFVFSVVELKHIWFKVKTMSGFINFIRKQKVISLAVAVVVGGAISKLVSAFVQDIINPFLGLVLGMVGGLNDATATIGSVEVMWGHFLGAAIDFLVIAFVVYYGIKGLGLDKLDIKD